MKKFIVLLLTLLIVAAFFVTAASAVEFDKPYIMHGSSYFDGVYSSVVGTTYGIGGCFGFTTNFDTDYSMYLEEPAYVIEDYRDENGFGDVWHRLDMLFEDGIGWNSLTVKNYKGIAFIFRGQGTYPSGKLRQIALIDGHDQLYYIWNYNEAVDPTDGYLKDLEDDYIWFGSYLSNYCYNIDEGDEIAYWFPRVFSASISRSDALAGGSLETVGIMKPIIFYGGAGPGGGGPGGGFPGGSLDPDTPDDNPSLGLTAFFSLILTFFTDLLTIPFFGGLFTLGDLIGVIISFSFLMLFIKWFAGG